MYIFFILMLSTQLLRIPALLLAIGAPLAFSSCDTNEKAAVAPVGAVKGEVYPAGAVTQVTATSASGQVYEFFSTGQTSAFQLGKLPAGDYTLVFTPTPSYTGPVTKQVTIRAGQTTVVPTFTLMRTGRYTGEMTWILNGQQYSTTRLSGQVLDDFFSVIGLWGPDTDYEEVALIVPGFSGMPYRFQGAGLYPFGLSEWTFGRYVQKVNNGNSATYSTYLRGQSAGSVTITELDMVARRAAGTFSFTAGAMLNATGTRQITNGRFHFSY